MGIISIGFFPKYSIIPPENTIAITQKTNKPLYSVRLVSKGPSLNFSNHTLRRLSFQFLTCRHREPNVDIYDILDV